MKEELIIKIIDGLIESTRGQKIKWVLSNSIFNKDTSKSYETFSEDGATKFGITISMETDFSFKDGYDSLIIFNKDLIDGVKYISSNNFKHIIELKKLIYTMYVKQNIPTKDDNAALKGILSSIGDKQQIRDRKIDSILGNSIFGKIFKS